jgi:uncharacterized protein YndB with AHSA1/START domain
VKITRRREPEGIATQLFRFATDAGPAQVWAALTSAELTPRYFYGLAARSEWRPGAVVAFTTHEGLTLSGEVLAAEEPRRLSYSLRAGDGQPETYVTWEIVGASGGAGRVVRLYVDEPGETGTNDETEWAWLKVVARLESVLAPKDASDRRR